MIKSNPLTKIVKEGDIVLFEIVGYTIERQICRMKNLKFQPADEQYSFDWLDFEVDVLYTTTRMHPTLLNQCIGNCMAIKEIIPEPIVEMYAANHNMWKATDCMLSDKELDAIRTRITNELENK